MSFREWTSISCMIWLSVLCLPIGYCEAEPTDQAPLIFLTVPYTAKVGDNIVVAIAIKPSAEKPVIVHLDPADLSYGGHNDVTVEPGKTMQVAAKVIKATSDGIAWVFASADGYQDSSLAINIGFLGHLRLNTTQKIPYGRASALAFVLLDKVNKPLAARGNLTIKLQSVDAAVEGSRNRDIHEFDLPANATVSQQFK